MLCHEGKTTSAPDNLGIQINPFPEGIPQKQSSFSSSGYPILHFLVLSLRQTRRAGSPHIERKLCEEGIIWEVSALRNRWGKAASRTHSVVSVRTGLYTCAHRVSIPAVNRISILLAEEGAHENGHRAFVPGMGFS